MSAILVKVNEIRCEKCGEIVPTPWPEGSTMNVAELMDAIEAATSKHTCKPSEAPSNG